MICYTANRQVDGTDVAVCDGSHFLRWLPLRTDLQSLSPDGFEWGYLGAGPDQLALAILADYLHDDKRALAHYRLFQSVVVSQLRCNAWDITHEQIDQFLATGVAGQVA